MTDTAAGAQTRTPRVKSGTAKVVQLCVLRLQTRSCFELPSYSHYEVIFCGKP
jgi:hypothetical protein